MTPRPNCDTLATLGHLKVIRVRELARKPQQILEPKRGIEPLTYALRVRCSTD
jgi:hypothetical protein